jgi:hypothetical protein
MGKTIWARVTNPRQQYCLWDTRASGGQMKYNCLNKFCYIFFSLIFISRFICNSQSFYDEVNKRFKFDTKERHYFLKSFNFELKRMDTLCLFEFVIIELNKNSNSVNCRMATVAVPNLFQSENSLFTVFQKNSDNYIYLPYVSSTFNTPQRIDFKIDTATYFRNEIEFLKANFDDFKLEFAYYVNDSFYFYVNKVNVVVDIYESDKIEFASEIYPFLNDETLSSLRKIVYPYYRRVLYRRPLKNKRLYGYKRKKIHLTNCAITKY